ncbi:heteroproteinous nuclear ribonucleoprotein L isoform X3, partial [Sigmodon hispidus]
GPPGGYHRHYHDEGYAPPLTRKGEGWAHLWGVTVGAQDPMAPNMLIPPPPPLSPNYGCHAVSPVLMVYGLDQSKMNCDRVFNVFCLYGNVEKVKFMKSKLVATTVGMADGYVVD